MPKLYSTPDNQIAIPVFLRVIIPVAVGVVVARVTHINPWIVGVCCATAMAFAWALRRNPAGSIYAWFSVALFFLAISELRSPVSRLPAGERIVAAVQIREITSVRGRWQHGTADVGWYKPTDSPNVEWAKVDQRIQLSVDTCYRVEPGMQMAVRGWLNPIDTVGTSYGELMRRRGYHSRMYLTSGNLIRESPHTSKTPLYFASRLHAAGAERLGRLALTDDALGVAKAMVVGGKGQISPELRRSYSLSGAAHLLAVSGLHVGIVFILINVILYLLPALRQGHVVKNIVAVVAVWLYAATAGLAPSVVRAAIMFSFAQIALATASQRNAMNIMLGSAVVMLGLNPNYATDPSFLLSYCAVLSIMVFFRPLYSLVKTPYKPVNALTSVVIVGFTATIGTAPLVSYWFGNLSVIGILINPVVILTAHAIVMLGVLWIMVPLSIFQHPFSVVIEYSARFQNAVVEWCSVRNWGILSGNMPLLGVLLCYLLLMFVAINICVSAHNENPEPLFVK